MVLILVNRFFSPPFTKNRKEKSLLSKSTIVYLNLLLKSVGEVCLQNKSLKAIKEVNPLITRELLLRGLMD